MENIASFTGLTTIELKCLQHVAEGKMNAEIGAEYDLTQSEVASIISDTLLKLKSPNVMAAIAKAARQGLLQPDDK